MSEQPTTPETADSSLSLGEDSYSDFTPDDYAIAPEDAEIAERIASFDPVFDVPSPVTGDTAKLTALLNPGRAAKLTLDSLGGPLREAAAARLQNSPPIDEHGAIMEVLYDNAYNTNVLVGPGENANTYQREVFAVTREIHEAEQEMFRIQLDFLEALRWDNEVDRTTGQNKPKQVDTMHPAKRKQLEHRMDELKHRVDLLRGWEGERRCKKALKGAVAHEKSLMRQVAIDEAAKKRAEEIVLEDEIEDRAQAYAKLRKTER